jgi:hypothetical protein
MNKIYRKRIDLVHLVNPVKKQRSRSGFSSQPERALQRLDRKLA